VVYVAPYEEQKHFHGSCERGSGGSHAIKKQHTKEIKRLADGCVAGRFRFLEGYQPSMWNIEPVKTITVHMSKLGKDELRDCDVRG